VLQQTLRLRLRWLLQLQLLRLLLVQAGRAPVSLARWCRAANWVHALLLMPLLLPTAPRKACRRNAAEGTLGYVVQELQAWLQILQLAMQQMPWRRSGSFAAVAVLLVLVWLAFEAAAGAAHAWPDTHHCCLCRHACMCRASLGSSSRKVSGSRMSCKQRQQQPRLSWQPIARNTAVANAHV
jgi:hypothetical protein